ncbi:MAG: helix-turn-helix domain-containing protein [Propionibacteriaceae bacterium]|nr:helix-turn-helix domain-containing protein [Propionibacteriaceae bacterium]MCL1840888.1 helix-turn-helix domain-containing protein [Propionibacteriaceae bacterium]
MSQYSKTTRRTRSDAMIPTAFTINQTADKLGVSPMTVRRRIADHTLKARKVGGLWLINARDLEALV